MKISCDMREDAVRLSFDGRFDASWSHLATVELENAIRSGRARIELDLAQVVFISSVGIGVLLRALTRMKSVGGTLSVVDASDVVREMLRLSRLDTLIGASAPVERQSESAITLGGAAGWTGVLREHAAHAHATARWVDAEIMRLTPEILALGHVALSHDLVGAAGHYGEGLIAGAAAVVGPADAPRPDCITSSEHGIASCALREGLVATGPFALHGYFDESGGGAVALSVLAEAIARAAGAPVAFVAAGECAGAFGVWSRSSPDSWRQRVASMTPTEMRNALRFAGEPMHVGDSLVAVVIACARAHLHLLDERVRGQLVCVPTGASEIFMHAHIATASYRPVPRSTSDARAIGALLSEQPLKCVMHALKDALKVAPKDADVAETAFARGVLWVMKLAGHEVRA